MRTPAGKECRHFYADYHRGRNVQQCKLIQQNPESLSWKPVDCSSCPVPAILNANSSPDLELKVGVKPRLLGLGRRVEVTASCLKHHIPIEDAYVGCPQCNRENPGLDIFKQALDQAEDQE